MDIVLEWEGEEVLEVGGDGGITVGTHSVLLNYTCKNGQNGKKG